ncbi:orotidine-5'-phosphate decarboxylase [Rhodoferax sp. 4810]|uniref:Orotidine 5'-phosphate decarboxylase n=1 Tax=Thiospirillum jenense TaxID=1653858 RepID=A0A839HCC1_9GAMM|nr:orotidine-5'-phosphate decarboxylase [Rhodoferax jenense]MBB1124689.1 orotidine-5'-phosphate decarboxylase [Thiospirillum jenense]
MTKSTTDRPLIIALDYPNAAAAWTLLHQLDPRRCRVKIGKELFTREGPALVKQVIAAGFDVFLDLKFHDIPNTVAAAVAAAADLGVWMVNVHASGGPRMLIAARERLATVAQPPLLIAVTVLTSFDQAELAAVGCAGETAARVLHLARLTAAAGLDGVVCSPQEAALIRADSGARLVLVTPGVRPLTAATDDQQRVMTPAAARAAGADYLVIGRPITAAPDPLAALAAIESELN